ncbi:sensor histidine kinase [Paenibacillus koleovorans]|uniref:sensor histidine kinase n=1 Tax=Paenibacillus koleovorans TaxID=121608 RepID=UPI0013E37E6F|nr:HAMP domain-containing sensor histidine kinase [Paenibacillus koleovorans]
MLFVWIALWGIGLFLIVNEPRTASIRWLALVTLFGGSGALAATLDERFIPAIQQSMSYASLEPFLYRLQATASLASYYGVPYAFCLYSLAYRPIRRLSQSGWGKWLPALLLLPVVGFLLFTPPYNELYPITFRAVVWWAVPLMLFGAANILVQRPQHPAYLATYRIVSLTVLLPVLVSMVLNYVLPSLGMLRMWIYNTWFVGAGVCLFVIGLSTYGFMGIRVFIDRRRLDSAFRAVTNGTVLLNHSMKNDAAKMRLFGQKIKERAASSGDQELLADIEVVLSASRHMQDMIARVHRKTEDLVLRPETTDAAAMIREVLDALAPQMKGITLHTDLAEGWRCTVDKAQTAEAIGNIVSNAVEAMRGQGKLAVQWLEGKKELTLLIVDSGPGMDAAQVRRALDPFYTTKSGSGTNFGLGLPYAYQVMRKHGGSLHIRSKPGEGTQVILTFPKRTVHAEFAPQSQHQPTGLTMEA